jgi:hypothetical protein
MTVGACHVCQRPFFLAHGALSVLNTVSIDGLLNHERGWAMTVENLRQQIVDVTAAFGPSFVLASFDSDELLAELRARCAMRDEVVQVVPLSEPTE